MTGQGARAIFEAALREGRLRLPYCSACARFAFPPGGPAAGCRHDPADYVWRDAPPRGTVHAATTVRRKPERGGDVGIVLVDLEAGVRVMAACEPDRFGPGMAVAVETDPAAEDPRLLAVPVGDAAQ